MEAAVSVQGRVVVVEGEPGIGKTSLIRVALSLAQQHKLDVLSARGGILEGSLGFGVARQLFEKVLADRQAVETLLDGPAALAAAALGLGGSGAAEATAAHGLYWLARRLSARRPLLICVDDAHWADEASLRFLVYLARRIGDLQALLITGWRRGERGPAEQLWAELLQGDSVTALSPRPLSSDGVAQLLERDLDRPAGRALCEVCFDLSGGNPFLVRELARTLAAETFASEDTAVERLRRLSPPAVARSVIARLARLSDDTRRLALVLAVLDRDATIARAAVLAGITTDRCTEALQALIDASICDPTEHWPRFRHPVIRTVIYDQIARPVRADMHRRAAEVLDGEGLSDRAVAHLLVASPAGSARAVEILVSEATTLPPAAAVPLLERALNESPAPRQYPAVLLSLGEALLRAGRAGAVDCLQRGVAAASDPELRDRGVRSLVRGLLLSARADEAAALVEEQIARTEPADVKHRLPLIAEFVVIAMIDPAHSERADEFIAEAGPGLTGRNTAERAIMSAAVTRQYERLDTPVDVLVGRAKEALPRDASIVDRRSDSLWPALVSNMLCRLDEQPLVLGLADAALGDRVLRRSALATMLATAERGQAELAMGFLVNARQDLEEAVALAELAREALFVHFAVGLLARALAEAGDFAEADQVLQRHDLGSTTATPVGDLLFGRAVLRSAQGRYQEARRDLETLEDLTTQRGVRVPAIGVRSLKARCLIASGDHSGVTELLEDELALALAFGVPSEIGMARRERALLAGRPDRIAELHQAGALLGKTPRQLEHAKTLLELGATLRSAGKLAEAREPLRAAFEIADRCGARVTYRRAAQELRAAGTRPRRSQREGPDSLTPAERRVAELAGEGLTTSAIAALLVVSPKTVETHLGAAFRKLGVHRRQDLRHSLVAATDLVES
jgi:DNA-binding CsgD family transcriptional regulator